MTDEVKLLVLLLILPASRVWAQSHQAISCPEVPGLAPLLKPGHVVLLGEMHGTNESPQFLSDALCVALQNSHSVTVGLELPFSETERADAFLESSGDAEAEQQLLKGIFGEKKLLIEVFLKAKKPPERYRPGGFSGERY